MSLLAIAMIREFPQYYHWYSVREFDYNGIKQQNRNGLLEKDPTVDGLKTGHTDSAGFCLVTSSLRNGMRLVSVVLGSSSMKARENASAALLGYGFTFYDTRLIAQGGARLATTPVWKADSATLDVGLAHDLYVTVPRSIRRGTQDGRRCAAAPDRPARNHGERRAAARLRRQPDLATVPVHPLRAVAAGGWWRRLVDTIRLWFA
jgi:serine-type D-Ala-D-Ala carboxypeptidase (penicillin-binding protein 5/6)